MRHLLQVEKLILGKKADVLAYIQGIMKCAIRVNYKLTIKRFNKSVTARTCTLFH